jgi:hypothetical protein
MYTYFLQMPETEREQVLLFAGKKAWFSSSVNAETKKLWSKYGIF